MSRGSYLTAEQAQTVTNMIHSAKNSIQSIRKVTALSRETKRIGNQVKNTLDSVRDVLPAKRTSEAKAFSLEVARVSNHVVSVLDAFEEQEVTLSMIKDLKRQSLSRLATLEDTVSTLVESPQEEEESVSYSESLDYASSLDEVMFHAKDVITRLTKDTEKLPTSRDKDTPYKIMSLPIVAMYTSGADLDALKGIDLDEITTPSTGRGMKDGRTYPILKGQVVLGINKSKFNDRRGRMVSAQDALMTEWLEALKVGKCPRECRAFLLPIVQEKHDEIEQKYKKHVRDNKFHSGTISDKDKDTDIDKKQAKINRDKYEAWKEKIEEETQGYREAIQNYGVMLKKLKGKTKLKDYELSTAKRLIKLHHKKISVNTVASEDEYVAKIINLIKQKTGRQYVLVDDESRSTRKALGWHMYWLASKTVRDGIYSAGIFEDWGLAI